MMKFHLARIRHINKRQTVLHNIDLCPLSCVIFGHVCLKVCFAVLMIGVAHYARIISSVYTDFRLSNNHNHQSDKNI